MSIFRIAATFLRAFLIDPAELAAENVALRQQLAMLRHNGKRPKLRKRDRIFWVWLSTLWTHWRAALVIVKPETVVRWHRQGFKLYGKWKSRREGRPRIEKEIRDLIRRMSRENPTWGAPRIHSELLLLGYEVAESTVSESMARHNKPSSQTWRTFLNNHVDCLASIDFFTVATAKLHVLYCCIVRRHALTPTRPPFCPSTSHSVHSETHHELPICSESPCTTGFVEGGWSFRGKQGRSIPHTRVCGVLFSCPNVLETGGAGRSLLCVRGTQ